MYRESTDLGLAISQISFHVDCNTQNHCTWRKSPLPDLRDSSPVSIDISLEWCEGLDREPPQRGGGSVVFQGTCRIYKKHKLQSLDEAKIQIPAGLLCLLLSILHGLGHPTASLAASRFTFGRRWVCFIHPELNNSGNVPNFHTLTESDCPFGMWESPYGHRIYHRFQFSLASADRW